MSHNRLPSVPVFKNTLKNYQIAHQMGHHRRRIQEVKHRKPRTVEKVNNTISYRDLLEQNPKKNYYIETKFTEIERENRLLFEKIASYKSKKKQKSPQRSMSFHQTTLNAPFRKKQIQQIEQANNKMYGRILKTKPSICFLENDKQFLKTRRLSNKLSKIEKNRLHDWY